MNTIGLLSWMRNECCLSASLSEQQSWSGPDDSWMSVRAGDTEPFSFGARRGRRRGAPAPAAAHAAALNQLALRLDGWSPPDPVCVDRVGVYFRNLTHIVSTHSKNRLLFTLKLQNIFFVSQILRRTFSEFIFM